MKGTLLSICAVLSLNIFGQTALQKADKLIASGNYLSAFKVLEATDPAHESAPILIKRSNLLLDYYIASDKHLRFALKDLAEGENLDTLREEGAACAMIDFRIDSLIYQRLEKEPDNFPLHLCLGRYFFEVYQKFAGEAFYPEQMLLTRMEMHCALAYKNGYKDAYSSYALGQKKLLDKEPLQAIPFFEDYLSFNPLNAEVHFNLALAYKLQGRRMKSIQSAIKAMEIYHDPQLKAETARMIAIGYAELKDTNRSLEFLRLADQIEPSNYYTLKYLLQTEILVDSLAFADTRQRFFRMAPKKNRVYQDLYQLHLNYNWEEALLQFYQSEMDYFAQDTLVRANLNLHSAILYKDLKEVEKCNAAVAKAVTDFKLIYSPNHDIFRFIGSYFRDEKLKE